MAPVNNELCAIDVSGLIIAAFSFKERMLFFFIEKKRTVALPFVECSTHFLAKTMTLFC